MASAVARADLVALYSDQSSGQSSSSSATRSGAVAADDEGAAVGLSSGLDTRLAAAELLLGFLLSPSGAFLRPALIAELADTVDAFTSSAASAPRQWLTQQLPWVRQTAEANATPASGAVGVPAKEARGEEVAVAWEALGRLLLSGAEGSGGDEGGGGELRRLRALAAAATSVARDPARQELRNQLARLSREVRVGGTRPLPHRAAHKN
jgi:hypothetical protein